MGVSICSAMLHLYGAQYSQYLVNRDICMIRWFKSGGFYSECMRCYGTYQRFGLLQGVQTTMYTKDRVEQQKYMVSV